MLIKVELIWTIVSDKNNRLSSILIFLIILIETTVSIVAIHVGVKTFILQDPNLASRRELLDTPERFYLIRYLKHTNGQRPWRLLSD